MKTIVDCEVAKRSFFRVQDLPEDGIDQPPQYALARSDDSQELDAILCCVRVSTWSSAETPGLLL